MNRFFAVITIILFVFVSLSLYHPKVLSNDDTTPPVIEISSPADNTETTESKIQVKGRVYDPESGIESMNIIGRVENIVESDGSFIFDWILAKNKNTVEIVAVNGAGMTTNKTLTITSLSPADTTPPIIMINSPAEGSETRENKIHVNATVMDPESGISAIKIIGNVLNITENKGAVDFDWNLTVEDKNYVDIEATNGAGLTATKRLNVFKRPPEMEGPTIIIELWIGRKTAVVDGKSVTLDVPPQIVRSRTVVPLRFIAEAFKAKVDYDSLSRTIYIVFGETEIVLEIDNVEATMLVPVDGKKVIKIVILEAPPFIQNGRTLVPVRFIAEAFGARVDWDSKQQKITISLKK
ncbi:copper amine oxidase N-terminal domain-containing protein [bacterium]|nr:copper amine oxidase N-terminal domain-containing protein [bacterium]